MTRRLLALAAWLLAAGSAHALELAEARHLLARAGFGASPRELQEFLPLSREAAVDRLLAGMRRAPMVPPPAWVDDPPPSMMTRKAMRAAPEMAQKRFRQERRRRGQDIKAWWYQEMIETDSPLTERMTLFWHNHFTSSMQKCKWPQLLYRQNLLLRRNASGSFRAMLYQVSRDPAMILYLDNQSNLKKKPNENFARELLELFTLGEGHYTERDIKEAARAFTGWRVSKVDGRFQKARRQHDDGEKTFMGRTGPLDGTDVLEVLLENPRVAEYITGKLWRELVDDEPPPAEIARIAAVFRDADYRLKPLLRAVLLADRFWDPEVRGTRIKSPVELMVGLARTLPIPLDDTHLLVQAGKRLGQDILAPPNVKGWPGGARWITSGTLLARRQVLWKATAGLEMEDVPDPMGGRDLRGMAEVLLAVPPVDRLPPKLTGWKAARRLLLDPAYQVN